MANRTMYVGDTYPDANFQVSDSTGVLDLSTAVSITVKFDGATHTFSGPGVPIWPPNDDPDGLHSWNCVYVFAEGDTATVDNYVPWIIVEWEAGTPNKVETFPTGDLLIVKAAPV